MCIRDRLGIPCIWDRLVQQCIKQVIEPICEAKFSDNSYGDVYKRQLESRCFGSMQENLKSVEHRNSLK